jgi:hypothetical protein
MPAEVIRFGWQPRIPPGDIVYISSLRKGLDRLLVPFLTAPA